MLLMKGVQLTNSRQNRPNTTQLAGLGYVMNFFKNSGSSWVRAIKQTHLTRPDPSTYLKIYYIINNFFILNFFPIRLFLYKTQLPRKF